MNGNVRTLKIIFLKLCAEMLRRFQWQIKNLLQELSLGPGFISILLRCRRLLMIPLLTNELILDIIHTYIKIEKSALFIGNVSKLGKNLL